MTIARTYQCPGTDRHPSHKFRYIHHPSVEADPLPRFCGICGFDSEGEDLEEALSMPHLAKTIGKTVDTMYRDMEAGAEHRANVAMEQFGMDASEASAMKITDMKDGMREGDTSDKPMVNDVTRIMESAPGVFGFQDAARVLGYSQVAHDTPVLAERNPGARTQAALRRHHAQTTAHGHAGGTTSTLPALETTAPGYRPRV